MKNTIKVHFCKMTVIQYQGEAEVVSGNTVGCSLELPGLCPGQYLPYGRSPKEGIANSKEHPTVLPDTSSALPRY